MRQIQALSEGLSIINREAGAMVSAEHDVVSVYGNAPLTAADEGRLTELGWFFEDDAWKFFV